MAKVITIEQHGEFAEEINELIDRVITLSTTVSCAGGKTKMRPIQSQLVKAYDILIDARQQLENDLCSNHEPDKFYQDYRKYRDIKQ